jgi:hypothetical protein
MDVVACPPTGSCYRREEYRMQRKYEVFGGCCEGGECGGEVCGEVFCNTMKDDDTNHGANARWWRITLLVVGALFFCKKCIDCVGGTEEMDEMAGEGGLSGGSSGALEMKRVSSAEAEGSKDEALAAAVV